MEFEQMEGLEGTDRLAIAGNVSVVGVVGAGFMGSGIAECVAVAGLRAIV